MSRLLSVSRTVEAVEARVKLVTRRVDRKLFWYRSLSPGDELRLVNHLPRTEVYRNRCFLGCCNDEVERVHPRTGEPWRVLATVEVVDANGSA